MSKTYVLDNPNEETLTYDYSGNTYYLPPGETKFADQGLAQHILVKFQSREVTLREE